MIEDKHLMITVYLSFEKAQLSENFLKAPFKAISGFQT